MEKLLKLTDMIVCPILGIFNWKTTSRLPIIFPVAALTFSATSVLSNFQGTIEQNLRSVILTPDTQITRKYIHSEDRNKIRLISLLLSPIIPLGSIYMNRSGKIDYDTELSIIRVKYVKGEDGVIGCTFYRENELEMKNGLPIPDNEVPATLEGYEIHIPSTFSSIYLNRLEINEKESLCRGAYEENYRIASVSGTLRIE